MSTEATAANPTVQAFDHIMNEVHAPVFFNKLAQCGIVPCNEKEAGQLMHLGRELFAQHQKVAVQEAEKQGSFLDFAVARLDSQIGANSGYTEQQVKQAAQGWLADANIKQAARTVAEALTAAA